MNARIKEIIVAIHNHKIVYADTNLTTFLRGMEALEPKFNTRVTVKKALDSKGVFLFVNDFGAVYEIYRYTNLDYKGFLSKPK